MSVDITQEEMDILNLNGISKDSVRDNVQYMRASGKSDDEIRQYFTNTITELKPITKVSHNTTGKIAEWENQGAITPYELAKKKSIVYTGKYDNIDENANLSKFDNWLKNSDWSKNRSQAVENRIEQNKRKIEERNKRVNEGTGSFLDRAGAALDRFGKTSYQAQQGNTVDVTALKAGVDTKTGTVIDNRDKSKPIGFQEALSDSFMTGAWIPFVGGFVSKADEKKQRDIQKHILNGEPIRPDEKAFLDKRLEEIQEARVRGYTLGGQIADSFLPSLVRFGAEIATGGALLEGLGLVSKVGEGASLTQKAVSGVGNMLKTGAANTVLPTGWNDIYENYQTRRLNKELDFTDKGQAIFQEAEEKPATSFVKSVGQTFTMFSSEASGELLSIPVKGAAAATQKFVGSPLSKYLSQNPLFKKFVDKTIPELSKYYEKINHLPIKGKNIDWLKSKVKFDGLLEEMGEEAVEDVLNLTLGTGDEKRTLDNYINAIFKSPDEWAVIAGAVALQGMSLSAASHIIGNHMANNGATAEEIQEVMNNTSEADKENMVESIIENGALDLSNFNTSEERFKDSVSKLAKNITSASGNQIDQDKIDKISNLSVSMLVKIAEAKGLDVDDVIEKEMADIEQINDEMFVDENGNLQTVSQENNAPVDIDSKINQLLEDYENLGEDYDNQEDLDNRIAEISLLDKIKSGELSLEDMEAANDLIAKYEEQGDKEFAQYLKNEIDNPQEVRFQRADFAGSENSADVADAIKEWKEKGTDSKYFKKWFGDSKVVDENGKPLVVYHGTNADFDKFEIGDVGFHFGNYEQANERMTDFSDGNPHIMSGYLKMENPLDIVSDVGDWLDVDTVKEYLHEYEVLSDEEFKNVNTLSQITSLLQNKGYDGIIYENQFEGKGKSYIVFNSSQFKSVDNRGTFDANNPNIYYQKDIKPAYEYDYIHNQVTGEKIDIEMNNDIKVDKIKPQKISAKLPFEISKKPSDNKKNIVKNLDLKSKSRDIQNKNTGEIAKVDKSTIEKSISNVRANGNIYNDFCCILYNIEKLYKNAQKILSYKDAKTNTEMTIKRYANVAKVNNNNYLLEFVLKDKGKVSLYSVKSLDNKDAVLPNAYTDKNLSALNTATYSITHIQKIFKSKLVEKYNNDYKAVKNKHEGITRLNQAAYHGTPHKFDEFSTENIGSGEGFQAHGWGLYFAADKNISEEYREKLIYGQYDKVLYNNKEIINPNTIHRLKKIYDTPFAGKKYVIEELNEAINGKQERIKTYTDKRNSLDDNPVFTESDKKNLRKQYDGAIKNLKDEIKDCKEQIEFFENVDSDKIVIKHKQGQLYKVDIPEDDVLLDEDKKFSEQPEKVQAALKKLFKELWNIDITDSDKISSDFKKPYNELSGGQLYQEIDNIPEMASKTLNKYGIKGITYDGRQDGRCYVIFDDKAVKILEKYYQKQNKLFVDNERAEQITNKLTKIKGSFIPAENLIQLFKDADESTIVHEFAHWWLEKLQKYAEDSEELQQDLAEIRKFVKNNGEPFTEEQHERFARGFEAYMRTGSAKTNRLKRLFEDFKNALLSLYDSIRSLGFSEDEIPEINNLFDRLLTTENQRIQAAVFDRCNTLQAQIDEIKANQEKELAEIDDIQATDMFSREEEVRKNKQINEYLLAAETAVNRLPKETKEYQKRYKDATFAILEAATGYKRQFIANPRNWEKVQSAFEATDRITASNGMLPEWTEFYVDEGVSYDNDDINGDENLASKAFDVMREGTYLPMSTDEYEEVSRFFGKLDYLSGKVMSLRGENKQLAMQAVDKLISTMPTLPDFAAHELLDKVTELHSTFIEQVSQERTKNVKELTNVPLTIKLRMYVTDKLNATKSYDPVSKRYIRLSEVNRLYKMLKYATNASDTKEIIRTINAHAIKQLENRQKGILHKEIQKQIKINSKLIKVGALKQGKFDWKTNTVFAELQQMNRLSLEDARKEYNRLINADAAVLGEERDNIDENPTATLEAPTDFQSVLKTKFLEYKTNRVNDLNLQATRSLLEDILELKFEGRRAKNENELKKALSRYDYQTNLVSILYANKDNKAAKYLARWVGGDTIFTSEGTLANWESLLNAVFNKETAQKYSLLKDEADVEVYAHEHVKEFYKKALDIYGLNTNQKGKLVDVWNRALDFDNTQPIVKLFQEYENEVYQFKQNTFNKDTGDFVETNVDITHAQLITLYAWSLNPELKKRIITQFIGEDVEDAEQLLDDVLFSKLSEQDKQFAWAMIDVCDSMYNDTNEVFIRTTGLSLPRTDNYIPSKTERIGSDLDMMHETILRSTNPSFIKQRKNCRRIKMDPQSPLAIIIPHINKTARYVVMSEKVNFYNRIFQAPDVKAALVDVFGKKSGEKIHRVILNQLATSTYENYARSITVGKNLLDTIASNYITSRIGGNLKVMFSQLTSVINYAENMPTHEWAIGFNDALAHPKDTIDFMFKNCPYLQARLAGNSQNEIIAQLTNESDKFRTLRNFCTANTKYGDILAIIFGGRPYIEHLMKQGMTQEEAFNKFVEDTLRSQQSGHNSATSAWQKSVAQNAITRMIFAFNNTNFQYERKFVDAMSNLAKGDISKQQFAKAFLIYKIFNPILFTSFLTDLSLLILIQNLLSGDDDWYKNFGGDILGSIALSNWKAYGILGLIANAIVGAVNAKATGGMFFEDSLPLISDFENSMQKLLSSKKLEFSDYIEMIAGAGDYTTGIAATRLYNATGGMTDVAKGDVGTGLLRILGYGKYRATMGATGHPPERKRRK